MQTAQVRNEKLPLYNREIELEFENAKLKADLDSFQKNYKNQLKAAERDKLELEASQSDEYFEGNYQGSRSPK